MAQKWLFIISLAFLVFIFMSLLASAQEPFTFEKEAITNVIAAELNMPGVFNLTITNTNAFDDTFYIFTLIDLDLKPIDTFIIPAGGSRTLNVVALPLNKRVGSFAYSYYIKGINSGTVEDTLMIKTVSLNDSIEVIIPESIAKDYSILLLEIVNKENIALEKVYLKASSNFFEHEETFSLGAKETKQMQIQLNEKVSETEAGTYGAEILLTFNDQYTRKVEKVLELEEFSKLTETESTSLFFFSIKKTIIKKNDGNTRRLATIELRQTKFENIFTDYDTEPTETFTEGSYVVTRWLRELEPNETFTVTYAINYTIVAVVLIIIVIFLFVLFIIKRKTVVVKKKAIKLRTKGGEMALKVVITAKNTGKDISNITLIDRLPLLADIHSRFGAIKPEKVEKHTVQWHFETLGKGQELVVSYILYSNIQILGSLNLPASTITFADDKNIKHFMSSNRLYFNLKDM